MWQDLRLNDTLALPMVLNTNVHTGEKLELNPTHLLSFFKRTFSHIK